MAEPRQIVTDVVIVGTGAAGMAAAIEAREAGAQVIMVDKAETLGGTSIISGGGCCIVGTPTQNDLGIHDNPDDAFEDWVKFGRGQADEGWARYYVEHSLHDLYFWAEGLGVKWIDMKQQEGNRMMRWHQPMDNGRGITTALIEGAKARGVSEILTSTEVTKVLTQDGRVSGIEAVNLKAGIRWSFAARPW